jgi:hypothetical protein
VVAAPQPERRTEITVMNTRIVKLVFEREIIVLNSFFDIIQRGVE